MSKTKVMVFGTFDLLHPGHINFLKQASELARPQRQQPARQCQALAGGAGLRGGRGVFLIVSVARDVNVIKTKNQRPIDDEQERVRKISMVPFVNKVMLGGLKDPWAHIIKQKPDIIALGYDQGIYVKNQEAGIRNQGVKVLEAELQKHGLKKTEVVRLKPFWPEIYKSKFIRKELE